MGGATVILVRVSLRAYKHLRRMESSDCKHECLSRCFPLFLLLSRYRLQLSVAPIFHRAMFTLRLWLLKITFLFFACRRLAT
mmetsp:Transcript_67475/g.180279  ORF Transcript_67475/g.180279 Transcript_67475/m.180279 type:complete len:82 (-) Transcript_67475:1542-1787(-)